MKILSLLDHPNINRLYETYEDKNYLYLVNEYFFYNIVYVKEASSLIGLMSLDASLKKKPDTFLFKWSKLSNTYIYRKYAIETSKLKTFCLVNQMTTILPSLILVCPFSGKKTWRQNLSKLDKIKLLELLTMSPLKFFRKIMMKGVIFGL